jgi:hypothetical protein
MYYGQISTPSSILGRRTNGARLVSVDDVLRSLPSLEAHCMHIWETSDSDIADFMPSGAGYAVLEEETFCTTSM